MDNSRPVNLNKIQRSTLQNLKITNPESSEYGIIIGEPKNI